MTFLEDVRTALDGDLLSAGEPHSEWELVENEYQDSGRWYEYWRAVYKRLDEHVAVEYSVPATEYQEVDEPYDDVYAVKPREVVKVVYEKE
jgi:hypothetical protein